MELKKLKVVLICHFSNAEVRAHLPLDNRRLYSFARKLLRLPTKNTGYGDLAPWDTDMIKEFRERKDLDFYVISAHGGLKRPRVDFESNNVHYSFISCDFATMMKHIVKNPRTWLKFNPMIAQTRRIVDNIQPDIVLLAGAENAHISSTLLGLNGYPIYVLCQTVYNNPERAVWGEPDAHNAYVEREIIMKTPYFGVYCEKHRNLLNKLSDNLTIFDFGWPTDGKLLDPIQCEKKYDFVNFALGMSFNKGFHDSIRALSIVKKKYPNVKLNLVGGGPKEVKDELRDLANEMGVSENVIFTDFFQKQEDMFRHIQQSRFAVLPCKMDNTSGTMSQSMQLGLPIVVYKTTGTPSFNVEKPCALIAEHSNIEDLASKMLMLMDDDQLAKTLKINARELQEKREEYARHNGERLIHDIRTIINEYHENKVLYNN